MKKWFKKIWFCIRHPVINEHVKKLKHVASLYPIGILDVDMAYNQMSYSYSRFKAMGEKYKWEFLEGVFTLSRASGRSWEVTLMEESAKAFGGES